MNTYTFYTDPGHAWLAVSVKEIKHYNIAHLISNYSYVDNRLENVYLEEDEDAYLFLKYVKRFDIEYSFQNEELAENNFIRSLPRFKNIYLNNKAHFVDIKNIISGEDIIYSMKNGQLIREEKKHNQPLLEGFYHV